MARIEIGKHLVVDTRVCGGRLIFRGSRILVSDALELAQTGYSPDAVARQHHGVITPRAVREAIKFIRRGIVREVDTSAKSVACHRILQAIIPSREL